MLGNRAALAVLLAVCLAFIPLCGLAFPACAQGLPACGPGGMGDAHGAAPANTETPAVLPLPATLPCMQNGAETFHCAPLAVAILKSPLRSRWFSGCPAFRPIPRQAELCYTDHPHHAPPSVA